jgi:hypothetical protein
MGGVGRFSQAKPSTVLDFTGMADCFSRTLTTGVDQGAAFTGGTGDDTFTAVGTIETTNGTYSSATFNTADVLVGGAGTDTINITIDGVLKSASATALNAASLTGIEVMNLRAVPTMVSTSSVTVDASLYAGLTTFNTDRSSAAITVTNLANGASAGVIGNASISNANALAIGYATTATAATLNFQNGTLGAQAVTLTGTGLLSTVINSTGAANVTGAFVDAASSKALTINATTGLTTGTIGDSAARTAITINATGAVTTGAVTSTVATTVSITGTGAVTTDLNAVVAPTITVSGSGAVTLGTLHNLVSTVTSTQTAGGLTATLGSLVTQKVTAGAGNDVITTPSLVLTTGSVDGGAGTDTLVIGANVGNINSSTLAAKYTNFETIRLNGTLDMSLLPAFTSVELSSTTNSITNLNATQAASVKAYGTDIGNSTITLASSAGTNDVLNLALGTGLTTAATANASVLTISGFETLNLTTNAGPTATAGANRISTITGAIVDTSLTNINLYGTSFNFSDISSTKAISLDGSSLIGEGSATPVGLVVAGSATAASTITGSNFADTFTIDATGSTYKGGAGNDTFISTQAIYASSVALDGGAGTADILRITDAAVSTATTTVDDNTFKSVSGFETVNFSGAVAGDFLWTLGGYANAVAAANGGLITVTAASFATDVAGDIITIDASGLSGTNALKLTMTNTSGVTGDNTGATSITGSAGADIINYTEATGATANLSRVISIVGGAGDDSITVTAATDGAINIGGGSGNDTIVGSVVADIINGGTGTDTLTGGATVANTFVFAAGDSGLPSATVFDTITDFTAVAGNLISKGVQLVRGSSSTVAAGQAGLGSADGVAATFNAADNTLALKIAAVEKALSGNTNTAHETAIFVDNSSTYVFIADGVAGVGANDILIKLTGVDGTNANFDVATLSGNDLTLA